MSQKTDRVISEILQKRDRFTKNFRTENHGGAAVIYGYPVHYKEGEEWKEIDNRLEKTENGYQNHASRVKVHFAESSNANEMVTIEKTGRKLSWGFLAEKQKKQNIRSQAAVQALKLYFSRKISIRQKKECRTEPQCRKQKKKAWSRKIRKK